MGESPCLRVGVREEQRKGFRNLPNSRTTKMSRPRLSFANSEDHRRARYTLTELFPAPRLGVEISMTQGVLALEIGIFMAP